MSFPRARAILIYSSYKKLCYDWHPDANLEETLQALQIMQAINRAYEQYKQRVGKG
jgi:DnaJ-class molecular chaperone